MKLAGSIIRTGALTAILVVLFVPILQDTVRFKKWEKPLYGSFVPENDTVLTAEGWFSGLYQEKKNKFINDSFGLHNYYIRLINEIDFRLFRKPHAKNVVVGKKDFLFEKPYISAYLGADFIGARKSDSLLHMLRILQDTLEKEHKLIFTVFAAGKASFYPEYIPDRLWTMPGLSNYEYMRAAARKKKINHIDFNAWFKDQKEKSRHLLYPQFGIHWSNYASMLVLDSVCRYIETHLHCSIPEMTLHSTEISDSIRQVDDDIIKAMNIFTQPKTFAMAYPKYTVHYDPVKHRKLKLLVIGDSFWWHIYRTKLTDTIFSSSRFWYYNNEMYPESDNWRKAKKYVANSNYADIIKQSDVIMIIHSEATLAGFGSGFMDMALEAYYEPNKRALQISRMKEAIRNYPSMYKYIIEKARARNLTVDSMLTLDAIYAVDNETKPH